MSKVEKEPKAVLESVLGVVKELKPGAVLEPLEGKPRAVLVASVTEVRAETSSV